MRAPHRTAIMASERAEENKFVFRRAAAALASRDFELAARLYKGLLKNDPENRDVLFALGDVYVKSGDDARALPYYEKINKIDPNDAASLIASGGIYRRLGRYDDALRSLRAALSAGGDSTAAPDDSDRFVNRVYTPSSLFDILYGAHRWRPNDCTQAYRPDQRR